MIKNSQIETIERAVSLGSNAVWRLLNGNIKESSRPLLCNEGSILLNPQRIREQLRCYHSKSTREYKAVPAGFDNPLVWSSPFHSSDLVLEIPDELVAINVKKLKNSAVPDGILPKVIKLLFGETDSVRPLGEMIRAIARTRIFPEKGKVARQTFLWKGEGRRGFLGNCRPITLTNVLLKLSESCIKDASQHYWSSAGFPRPFWGHFFGAPESIYVWMSTIEARARNCESPITALTDVSQAFNRLNHMLFRKKLFDLGLPRQLIELVIEFMSGIRVKLCWGRVQTDFLERGDVGAPQGSLEGMWNFGVYADNIHKEISNVVTGIGVGSGWVREVVYAHDISLINGTSGETTLALKAVFEAGAFDAFKFKSKKCKILGAEESDHTTFYIGDEEIKRVNSGILLGAVINKRGIDILCHVRRRADMVGNAISQLKSWRTKGLPFRVVFNQLFMAKVLPRFSYAFALIPHANRGIAHGLILKTLSKALENACGWQTPRTLRLSPSIWFPLCGFPPVLSFLRKMKLELAARLKLADHKAGRIFKSLLKGKKGVFETDTITAVEDWLLVKSWKKLDDKSLRSFRKKIQKLAKKKWPLDLPTTGSHKWLYHNHSIFSGNVPAWASWDWPESSKWKMGRFECHFYCLVTGCHPAFSVDGKCWRSECKMFNSGSLYEHHFFKCESSNKNRIYFKEKVYIILEASEEENLLRPILNKVLLEPSTMWIGLMEYKYFDLGLKMKHVHELHRILTIASILSWGRFYKCPLLL